MSCTKVMKYELRYIEGCGEFKDFQKEAWAIQRTVRTIKNKTVQLCYALDKERSDYKRETGEDYDLKEKTGYKSKYGYINNQLKPFFGNACSNVIACAIQKALKKYNDSSSEIWKGEVSLPSYKSDQPIGVSGCNIKLDCQNGEYTAQISLLGKNTMKENGWKNPKFKILVCDDTQESIINRVIGGEYRLAESCITYMKSKKNKEEKRRWFLMLSYSFEPDNNNGLDKDKVLGVDLGVAYALYAASKDEWKTYCEPGKDIMEYTKRIECRIRDMQRQGAKCGYGRIGHGTATRIKPIYKLKDKASKYRDTKNHTMSRHLIDFAIDNGYGTIQMEDLSGIKEDTGNPKFLRHWTYFDLQTKIEQKAKQVGIEVKKINPQYTSQRCSKCGYIDKNNRPEQAKFICQKCGNEMNADLNAAINISIPDIDLIISNEIGYVSTDDAKGKKTKKRGKKAKSA